MIDPAQITDLGAERSTLGGVLIQSNLFWDVHHEVRADDFSDARHAEIFTAIETLANQSQPVDVITVGDWLRARGKLNDALTIDYLHDVVSSNPLAASAPYHASIVAQTAGRRRLAVAAERIAGIAAADGVTGDPVERAREALEDAQTGKRSTFQPVSASIGDLIDELEQPPQTVRTPWVELDRYLAGWRPGALYVIGARPGAGKTVVGLQSAVGLSQHGDVGFVSLEMPEREITRRLVAQLGEVSLGTMMGHQLTDSDWRSVAHARQQLQEMSLYVNDEAQGILDVVSYARALHSRGRMAGLVVDYLQLMQGERAESRQVEVAAMSRKLKQLAIALNIPVIALSQLNRASTVRKGKDQGPQLADLRESGAIEQDADVVILLHREMAGKEGQAARDAELKVSIAKNRHGRMGEVTLLFEGRFARAMSKKVEPLWLDEEERSQ